MSLIRSTASLLRLGHIITPAHKLVTTRSIKRWVAPTLRELNKRAKKLGPPEPQPRSGYVEWNYRAELFAFGKRLNENFQLPQLQTAFTLRSYIIKEELRQKELGIEETGIQMEDNSSLAESGAQLAKEYVEAFIAQSLPKLTAEGQKAICDSLLNTESLAGVALGLGMKELLLSAEYPPASECLAKSLLAVIGALEKSSGMERAYLFVRDFICTQLNQKDILDLWHIEEPEELLKQQCAARKMPEPEPRLLGNVGQNTVLAAYHVGLYSNKKLLGKGFGEDIPTAVKTASLDALQTMFGIRDNMKPLEFRIEVQRKSLKLKQ